MTDYRAITDIDKKFAVELMAEKAIYTKIITYLEDKQACKNAGYTFYKRYPFHNDYVTGRSYILAYDNPKKEYLQFLFVRDYRYNDLYELESHIYGKKFVEFCVKFLKNNCEDICQKQPKYRGFFENFLDPKKKLPSSCYVTHSHFYTNSTELVKPLDVFKILNDMKPLIEYANIFPCFHSHRYYDEQDDGSYKLNVETDGMTLENLALSDKYINAIMAGIDNYDRK